MRRPTPCGRRGPCCRRSRRRRCRPTSMRRSGDVAERLGGVGHQMARGVEAASGGGSHRTEQLGGSRGTAHEDSLSIGLSLSCVSSVCRSDAPAAEDEEQQGNDRQDDENGVQHGPCSTPDGPIPNVKRTEIRAAPDAERHRTVTDPAWPRQSSPTSGDCRSGPIGRARWFTGDTRWVRPHRHGAR